MSDEPLLPNLEYEGIHCTLAIRRPAPAIAIVVLAGSDIGEFADFPMRELAKDLNRYGAIENFPPDVVGDGRGLALLFKNLATLRTDATLFGEVDELRWRGPTDAFAAWIERLGDSRVLERCLKVSPAVS